MKFKQDHIVIILGILSLFFLLVITISIYSLNSRSFVFDPSIEGGNLYEKCSKHFSWQSCYSDRFELLIKNNSFSDTNLVLQNLKNKDKRLISCHSLAHTIAKGELNKNPDNWPALAKVIDAYDCANGYVHGMLEGLLLSQRIELTTNSLSEFCDRAKKHLGGDENDALINCYHNVGHLLMLQSGGDIESSVNICSSFSTSMNRYFCYSGVFMEEFVRDGLSDHGIKPKITFNEENTRKEEGICQNFDGETAKACWREIVTMYRHLSKNDPVKVFEYCSHAKETEYIDECYSYGLYLMISASNYGQGPLESLCQPLLDRPESYKYCLKMEIIALAYTKDNLNKVKDLCLQVNTHFQDYCRETSNERFMIQAKEKI